MNNTERAVLVTMLFIGIIFSIELLNYQSWVMFCAGIALIVSLSIGIIKILYSLFKQKTK